VGFFTSLLSPAPQSTGLEAEAARISPVLSLKMAFFYAPFYPQWKNNHAHWKDKGPQKKSMLPQVKGPFPKRKECHRNGNPSSRQNARKPRSCKLS
jgi:hypothetical protein